MRRECVWVQDQQTKDEAAFVDYSSPRVFADDRECYNFSPGPVPLPKTVLDQVVSEMYNYRGSGQSVLELSHRQDEFRYMSDTTKDEIRKFLKVPDNYRILLQQGGATMQYTAIAKNLIGLKPDKIANLMITGLWSKQNHDEMAKHSNVNVVADNYSDNDCTKMVDPKHWRIDPRASYFYMCPNETVHGFEINLDTFPWDLIPDGMPVVADMSSMIGTKPIPWEKLGVVFMGSQKNLGTAGCTIICVREDLLGHAEKDIPILCDWQACENSPDTYYNTPAIFPMYVTGLNCAHMNKMGGLAYYTEQAKKRSDLLWNFIDESQDYYKSKIVDKDYRSRLNVIFRIAGGNVSLEQKFIEEAAKAGIVQIKAHAANPAVRISMYNSMPYEGVVYLTNFMRKFMRK